VRLLFALQLATQHLPVRQRLISCANSHS
jgi:hypothetical protein